MARGTLKVLTRDPATGQLVPGIPRPPEFVSGIDKLVQIVALELLNNGGRSIYNPSRAGGLRVVVGQSIDWDDPAELFADIQIAVSRTEKSIKSSQANTSRGPSERLATLQLIDVVPDENTLSAGVIIGVINEENTQAQATVAMP